MADRTQRALGIARRSAHQHAFDRAFQEGGGVALPQITVRPDDEQQPPDDAYDPLAAATSEPSPGLAGIGHSVADWWQRQPSWLEQAAAVRQQADPTSPRPSPAEIEFASGMVGPATIHGVRAPLVAPAVASPFYSAAEEAVKNTPMHAASGPQWLGVLRNATGVKPEELEWAGVPDFLQGRQGAVSKQELLDHIAGNKVEVQEVMKGGDLGVPKMDAIRRDNYWEIRDAENGNFITNIVWPNASREEAIVEAADRWRQQDPTKMRTAQPKFGSYTLPGGANYRELLLTMPDKGGNRLADLELKMNAGTATLPERQEYQSLVGQKQTYFRGSHWDEPNVLAHVRFDDRNIGGDKTLHMAEIQSDWHQKGRREGYATELVQGKVVPQDNSLWRVEWSDGTYSGGYHSEAAATQAMQARASLKGGVPDAPFKTTWPELALKRMIRYAAEHGYDRISWDSGATNAERYDLSKHVDSLQWRPDTGELIASKGGTPIINSQIVPREKLADTVGKEAADKLIASEPTKIGKHVAGLWHTLQGADLKVGGEGMKGFYDKMLPTIANKLGKKYGARVEQGDLRGMQYRGYSSFVYGEGPLGHPAVYGVKPNGEMQLVRQNFADQLAARNEVEKLNSDGDLNTVHTLKITPELRKAALQQGFPMFAKGGKVTAGQMARRHAHQQAFDQAFPRR